MLAAMLSQPLFYVVLNMYSSFQFQFVKETTWSRVINGVKKESLIDHVYVNNAASVLNATNSTQLFGDHSLVVVELILKSQNEGKNLIVRNWSNY